ncbi:hypothetical protein [uncultured Sphingomonas sp.]|uniref:hypothetical protein n=1 Tax=uncultured Sphingomonas sp. TaxID=158754 RepID=UPI0025D5B621|nr:hypothetical protein [uncultured Sphingomonas sp.]
MADLTKFVNSALKQGESFDVYLNRFPKIGTGFMNTLNQLNADLKIDASVLGNKIQGDIAITMPDLSPSGTCTINLLGNTQQAPYRTQGNKLEIDVAGRTVTFYGGSKEWSWIDVSGVPGSIGIWPTSHVLRQEDEVDLAGALA